jgi:IS605 OrfB family transposase
MTDRRLREWRGVKDVASPAGVAVTTRLATTPEDDAVLDTVAGHIGRLRRADLAACSRPVPLPPGLGKGGQEQARKDRLNARKQQLTARSSSRWASAIIRANDARYQLERRNQARHIASLKSAIAAIGARLTAPTQDSLTAAQKRERRQGGEPKGYATRAERHAKQRRLQSLQAELARVTADYETGRVRIADGGKRLARSRHHLEAAGLTAGQWRERWQCARWRIEANGSRDEPYGNLTITVTPQGQVSIRLPRPLEHLANAPRGRRILSGTARFSHRAGDWAARITGGGPVSYGFTRKPGRAGVYLTASWALTSRPAPAGDARAGSDVVAVDTNDGFFAVRRLDAHGNPAGAPRTIAFDCTGTSARRDAQVRHAITRLTRHARRHDITVIAIEDLNFADARQAGRETMGRGTRGKTFRRTVAGIPTAVIRSRLTAMASRAGIRLIAVNPAYTSQWGDQHWRKPYQNVTRHEAAATVIGRRAQGHKARRRARKSRTQPAGPQPRDRVVETTAQAGQSGPTVNAGNRPRPGTRGTKSRPPSRPRTRSPDSRATVTPASGPQRPTPLVTVHQDTRPRAGARRRPAHLRARPAVQSVTVGRPSRLACLLGGPGIPRSMPRLPRRTP